MKSLIIILSLFLSVNSFAAPEPVRRLTTAEARTRVEKSRTYEEILRMQRDPSKRAQLMAKIEAVVKLNLKDVIALDSVAQSGLVNLVNVHPLEVLSEVARLSSTVKDPSVSARDKQMAQTTLRLMAQGSRNVTGIFRNAAEANAQKATAMKILQISNKIAALSMSPNTKQFVEAYERALREGKSVDQAVRIASKGKFTEKELRECE